MAFNTIPANGWPQLKQLQELAEKVDNMPTYTSVDRDFLDTWESVLPISDEVDPGQYTLTATKSELGATYSWEEPETGLPEDPSEDGVKVLTATTESGETVKTWEDVPNTVNIVTTGNISGNSNVEITINGLNDAYLLLTYGDNQSAVTSLHLLTYNYDVKYLANTIVSNTNISVTSGSNKKITVSNGFAYSCKYTLIKLVD